MVYMPTFGIYLIYIPTLMVNPYGFHVGTYTSPMDPMGTSLNLFQGQGALKFPCLPRFLSRKMC